MHGWQSSTSSKTRVGTTLGWKEIAVLPQFFVFVFNLLDELLF